MILAAFSKSEYIKDRKMIRYIGEVSFVVVDTFGDAEIVSQREGFIGFVETSNPDLRLIWGGAPGGSMVDGSTDKPPLGLRPKEMMYRDRLKEIEEAIKRYADTYKQCPESWLMEKKSIQRYLKDLEEPKIVLKEINLPKRNEMLVTQHGVAWFYVPADSKNHRCLFEVKE